MSCKTDTILTKTLIMVPNGIHVKLNYIRVYTYIFILLCILTVKFMKEFNTNTAMQAGIKGSYWVIWLAGLKNRYFRVDPHVLKQSCNIMYSDSKSQNHYTFKWSLIWSLYKPIFGLNLNICAFLSGPILLLCITPWQVLCVFIHNATWRALPLPPIPNACRNIASTLVFFAISGALVWEQKRLAETAAHAHRERDAKREREVDVWSSALSGQSQVNININKNWQD